MSASPRPVPISVVQLGEEEERLVLGVLRSGVLSQGPLVAALEERFAQVVGVRYAVAVSSGTIALVAAVQALALPPGAEVLTSALTFVATLNAILDAGACVRFVDIGDDFNLDPDCLAERMSDRTGAILPVHLYGLPADMGRISATAGPRGVSVVEDAAQAHGARVAGHAAGSFGLGCFSLYATKNITAGEGGIVTTDDDTLVRRLRLLRNHGMQARYNYETPGHNYRMTELQAAVAVPQLNRLSKINKARARNAVLLNAGLADVPGLRLPEVPPGREHVWHQYTVQVTADAAADRDALANALAQHGISTAVYYPRMVYDYPCFRNHPRVRIEPTPRAERAAREVLSLPVHPALTEDDLERIITVVREVLDG